MAGLPVGEVLRKTTGLPALLSRLEEVVGGTRP
jgi:hypothetical protein